MPLHLNRRRWVFLLGSCTAAAPLLAQTTPSTPEQRLDKAKLDVRETSNALAAIQVPMAIEPSFRFTAE